jgi:hypothetical protein
MLLLTSGIITWSHKAWQLHECSFEGFIWILHGCLKGDDSGFGNYLYYLGTDDESKDDASHQHSIPRMFLLFRRKFLLHFNHSEFREIELS